MVCAFVANSVFQVMPPVIDDIHPRNDDKAGAHSAPFAQPVPRRTRKKAVSIAIRYHELSAKHPDEEPKLELPYGHKDPLYLSRILTGQYLCSCFA